MGVKFTSAQRRAFYRLLAAVGAFLVARGVVTADTWAQLREIVEPALLIVGTLVADRYVPEADDDG